MKNSLASVLSTRDLSDKEETLPPTRIRKVDAVAPDTNERRQRPALNGYPTPSTVPIVVHQVTGLQHSL
jgi:hypothetical protein